MKKDTSKKKLHYHVEQIAWIIDPNVGPEEFIKFLLVRFRQAKDIWTVYEVTSLEQKSTRNPFRYYYYLFILSTLAYQQLQKVNETEDVISKEQPVWFPIQAYDDNYGRLVKYYYNLKGKEGSTYRYKAIPPKLREGMREMFLPQSKRKAAKCSRIELKEELSPDDFHFWNIEDFPVEMFSGQTPKKIETKELDFHKIPVDIDIINNSIHQFRLSKRWAQWERKVTAAAKKKYGILEPMEKVLDMANNGPFKHPVWFRPSGPLAIDFQHHRVHINKEKVTALKDHVLNHQISMIEAPPATGKTVLVRCLALECYNNKNMEILYFDFASMRDLSPIKLAEEIESTEGLFIIENIHLEPRKLSTLLSKLHNLDGRHILLTSRPLFSQKAYLSPDQLKEISFFSHGEIFDDADDIIELYTSQEQMFPSLIKSQDKIKEITFGNYKMLGYLLEGCTSKKGRGEPEEWIEEGVNRELEQLEYAIEAQDGPDRTLPEVLLSLAPLYMDEILTEESFLRNELGFNKDDFRALDILIELGEVRSQRTKDGFVFYGLFHSAQAKACWNYGTIYKKRRMLPEYDEFVYRYVSSGMPNGLEAVLKKEEPAFRQIVKKLKRDSKLETVIENSVEAELFADMLHRLEDAKIVSGIKIVEAAVRHIEKNNLFFNGLFIRYFCQSYSKTGKELWTRCKKELATRLNRSKNISDATTFIQSISQSFPYMAKELCDLVNPVELAENLIPSKGPSDIGFYIHDIFECNSELGEKIWPLFRKKIETLGGDTELKRTVSIVKTIEKGAGISDRMIIKSFD